ncbi:MAG: hypothetical protein H6R15_71 [Proteobacteria bacterium]|nr:hypothetical protein [Pseudomonadota bacterium]
MKHAVLLVSLLLTIAACFFLGMYIFKRRGKARRRKVRSHSEFPLSAFSVLNHPAVSGRREQLTPLREAEVYMTYGKKREAQRVLDTALENGEISAADVAEFWGKHNSGAAGH